jgi:endonuclease/exonuclease/phosphatase family metal-dependent hydrolase
MSKRSSSLRHLTLLVAATALLAVGAGAATAKSTGPAAPVAVAPTVTVMTHNLYFGSDLGPVVAAVLDPSATALDLFTAVANAYTTAQSTNFAGRAAAWAAEIALARPDLVGLQEAVQWRTGPAFGGNASTDAGDFVQLLLAALSARGQHYSVASESTGYDVEAPALLTTGLADVRLTQHEVILVRRDAALTLTHPQAGQYAAHVTLSGAFGTFPLPWSWASVDVTKSGRTFRFITTHLDPDVGPYQLLQEQELLSGPAATTLPVIWVGDLNSDAAAASITGVVPDTLTSSNALAAGFMDSWTATRSDAGFTCCESADLLNPTPTLDQRLDYVLTRGAITPKFDFLVGNSILERLLFGRWSSDHAGLAAVLQLGS